MQGSQSFFSLKDLDIPKCRYDGISLIKVNGTYLFNYTTAEAICNLLGLSLASKWQVNKANHHGYETCSYGWVSDGVGIISRIQPNTKCGQNKTGIVPWHANFSKSFHTYCFNSSDIWINSCKPESSTTAGTNPPTKEASTWAKTSATLKPASHDTSTIFQILKPAATKKINSNEFSAQFSTASPLPTERITTESDEENLELPKQKDALRSDNVIFGGLPIALLVLALVFFIVAAALAVCYVRKYVETVPFSSKKKQKEDVETKVFKEARTGDNVADKEQKNGKPVEKLENKLAATVQCVEAEV
ncbi:lymphatic vessel endothelial hyaluronic acid receptor 1 [Microcaecilia unicolor]|uniref:Lymphatic vessel endothelial hyaluronic acid receptor 1 n=1 Tax=Microcaecilia unicolor TaxID=1415580 RepID=A0A6P7Y1D0_9AMPH|nr:lymphatic vessel endothelial hyaluronic acid receptor 1 [Microcaecilia unicolor]